jgi:Concanavalin A-like lectin/glucanases superfamily
MRRVIVCALLMLVGPLATGAHASLDTVPSTANLWVDTDGGTCTRSSSPTTYSNAAACSPNAALAAASGGDTVLIKGGSYGLISLTASAPGSVVKFFGAAGETVTGTALVISGTGNVSVQGIDQLTDSIDIENTNHVWVKDTYTKLGATDSPGIYTVCADDTHLEYNEIQGDYSLAQYGDGIQLFPDSHGSGCHSDGITIDHAYVHDLHDYNALVDNHEDALQVGDAQGLTVKNSRFNNCSTQCVFVSDYNWAPAHASDIVLENNMIGYAQSGSHAVMLGGATNYTLRNNSVAMNAYFRAAEVSGTFTVTGNIINFYDDYNCSIFIGAATTASNNLSPTACATGTTSATVPDLWVDDSATTGSWDLHLASGTNAAVDAMPAANAPATDFDGDSRPIGGNADIGADERSTGSDTTPPDTSITSTAIGSSSSTSASFTFTGSDNVTASGSLTFECKLDAGSYSSCTSPKAYTGLSIGSHTFSVRATDAASNTDATAASETWTVVPAHVLAYHLSEGSGTTTADAWGSHTGTLGTSASNRPAWTTGYAGGALDFDGSNDFVSSPDTNDLDLNHFTLMAWVRPTSLGSTWRTIIFKNGVTREQYALYVSAGNSKPSVWASDPSGGSTAEVGVNCSSSVSTNTWVHVAGTYDGSNLKIYKDGVLCGTQALTGTIPASTGDLTLGNSGNLYPEKLVGKIDEVKMFDGAMTQTQIQAEM